MTMDDRPKMTRMQALLAVAAFMAGTPLSHDHTPEARPQEPPVEPTRPKPERDRATQRERRKRRQTAKRKRGY